MKRRTFDKLVSYVGLGLAALLLRSIYLGAYEGFSDRGNG